MSSVSRPTEPTVIVGLPVSFFVQPARRNYAGIHVGYKFR